MRFLLLLPLALLTALTSLSTASASPQACMNHVRAKYMACQVKCDSMGDEAGRIDCVRGCHIEFSIGQRECQKRDWAMVSGASATGLELTSNASYSANWNEDGGCKLIKSNHDGRTRALCMGDGTIYETWGQCRTYCR